MVPDVLFALEGRIMIANERVLDQTMSEFRGGLELALEAMDPGPGHPDLRQMMANVEYSFGRLTALCDEYDEQHGVLDDVQRLSLLERAGTVLVSGIIAALVFQYLLVREAALFMPRRSD